MGRVSFLDRLHDPRKGPIRPSADRPMIVIGALEFIESRQRFSSASCA